MEERAALTARKEVVFSHFVAERTWKKRKMPKPKGEEGSYSADCASLATLGKT
jgi:hypothetical protein